MKSYKEKLSQITTLIFDVDGVLTDGKVFLLKDTFVRAISSRDSYAIQYAAKMEFRILIITGGSSEELKNQLLELGVTEVCLRSSDKLKVYEALKEKYHFTNEQALYMGDDIPDHPVLKIVGVSTCPQDATHEIKEMVDYQSPYLGGNHCVRDVIEQTLRVQKKWFSDGAVHW